MLADASSLEGLGLKLIPEMPHRGGRVMMICSYDLGTSPLCYVKWYRGNFEFYRYTPSEDPPHKLFPYPGVHVNVSKMIELFIFVIRFYLLNNYRKMAHSYLTLF